MITIQEECIFYSDQREKTHIKQYIGCLLILNAKNGTVYRANSQKKYYNTIFYEVGIIICTILLEVK